MSWWFQITAVNAVCAAALAVAVALGGRYVKRPSTLHALWILVLLQLFMPPVLEVELLPRPERLESVIVERVEPRVVRATWKPLDSVAAPGAPGTTGESRAAQPVPVPVSPRLIRAAAGKAAAVVWIAGSLWILGLTFVRAARFRRLLNRSTAEDLGLERRLTRLAAGMGVRRPGLRLLDANLSPSVLPRLGGAELLFPVGLLSRLDSGEKDAILAHEMAHVARRDHWVRLLELLAISLFWWHPAVWWARARLRLAEERCCDQLVMHKLPDLRPSYARGLLKTVEFLAGSHAGVPALASGVGEARDLKERLTMILRERPPESMSRTKKVLLAACAVAVLLIFPTWTDPDARAAATEPDDVDPAGEEIALEAAEREYVHQRLELEQQAIRLEHALQEIRERQAELEQRWRSTMHSHEPQELEHRAARARADGERVRAEDMYERARELSLQAEREARLREIEIAQARHQAGIEYSLRQSMLELERATAEDERERAAELRREVVELEERLRELIVAQELERHQMEHDRVEARIDRLLAEAAEQRETGNDEIADRIEAEIESLRERRAEERIRRELEIRRLMEEMGREGSEVPGIVR